MRMIITSFEDIVYFYRKLLTLDWRKETFLKEVVKGEMNPFQGPEAKASESLRARLQHFMDWKNEFNAPPPNEGALGVDWDLLLGEPPRPAPIPGVPKPPPPPNMPRRASPQQGDVNLLTVNVPGRANLEFALKRYFKQPSLATFLDLQETIKLLRRSLNATPGVLQREHKQQFLAWLVHEMDRTFREQCPPSWGALLPAALLPARKDFEEVCTFACSDWVTYNAHTNSAFEALLENRCEAQSLLNEAESRRMGVAAHHRYQSVSLLLQIYHQTFRYRIASCTDFAPVAAYILIKHQCRGRADIISNGVHNFVLFTPNQPNQGNAIIIDLWLGSVGKNAFYPNDSWAAYPFTATEAQINNPLGSFQI